MIGERQPVLVESPLPIGMIDDPDVGRQRGDVVPIPRIAEVTMPSPQLNRELVEHVARIVGEVGAELFTPRAASKDSRRRLTAYVDQEALVSGRTGLSAPKPRCFAKRSMICLRSCASDLPRRSATRRG